ncbi:hypothetical protein HYX58_04585 [Candidatus Dependentiae bacterium]|nr:hypothetical protein [Candidatus Dependentiae bacterium]
MHPTLISARYTLHDAWHHRIVSFASALCASLFFMGSFFTTLIVSGHTKVLIDFCCGAYHLFSIMFVLIFVVNYLHRLEQTHFYHWFLTSGCTRYAFLIGSFCAFSIIIFASAFLFFFSILLFLYYQTNIWFFYLWPAFCMYALEGILLISFALFWSMLLSLYWCYAALLGSYLMCVLNHSWIAIMQQKTGGIARIACFAFYYLMPDLELINIQSNVMYELPINYAHVFFAICYSACFCAVILFATIKIFEKKNL